MDINPMKSSGVGDFIAISFAPLLSEAGCDVRADVTTTKLHGYPTHALFIERV